MSPDPIPEEELPPRLRFERLVDGPAPHIFRSARPASDADPRPIESEVSSDPGPDGESDAAILKRFEALKRSLGGDIQPASPAPANGPPSSPPARPIDDDFGEETEAPDEADTLAAEAEAPFEADTLAAQRSIDELQSRIRRAKQQERENSGSAEVEAMPAEDEAPHLTYDELERLKDEQAKGRQREAKKEKRRQRRKNRSFWRELPILILVALVVAIVIKTFFFQAFYIPSGSMIPALEVNDRVLVNKLSYQFGAIERGDILVFDSPEVIDVERSFPERILRSIGEATGLTSPDTVLIKRVIGLPGETVAIRDNQVYVNDNPIAEPYLPEGTTLRDFDEINIPADHVFMMGDNRNQSRDSRVFGPIPREDIVGRAFVTVWPPGAWGGL